MPPGPPPQPLEKKRMLGNPGHQKLPDQTVTHAVGRIDPRPPRNLGLGTHGRRLWGHVASLPWVSTSDAAVLAEVCTLADRLAALRADIAEHGQTFEARGRRYANPALALELETSKRLTSLLAAFGLTPGDRSRLGIAEVKARTKLEELAERREARRAARDAG